MKAKHIVGMVLAGILLPSCLAFGQRLRLPEGTPVWVRLKADLASDNVTEGKRVDFEVARPVIVQGVTVIPAGAISWGAVQSYKAGKFIKFDIEGIRLPDLAQVKLRATREKPKNPGRDQIKIESRLRDGIGAAKGTEYTAYVDEEIEVGVAAPSSAPPPGAASSVAATTPPPVAPVASNVAPAAIGSTPESKAEVTTAVPAPQAIASPVTPAAAPAATSGQAAPPLVKGERVTVECFSDPTAADILVDGEFYGNTPSILKLSVGKHELEIQLSGYKTYAIPLVLQSGTGVRTIHPSLEQKE